MARIRLSRLDVVSDLVKNEQNGKGIEGIIANGFKQASKNASTTLKNVTDQFGYV